MIKEHSNSLSNKWEELTTFYRKRTFFLFHCLSESKLKTNTGTRKDVTIFAGADTLKQLGYEIYQNSNSGNWITAEHVKK